MRSTRKPGGTTMTYDARTKYDADVAASYDIDRQSEEHWQAETSFVGRYAETHEIGEVLDVPVGTGRMLKFLTGAERIVGLDLSDEMLAIAQVAQKPPGIEQVELARGDALRMTFVDDSFDLVVCFRLVHLLPPELVKPLLVELSRVCRGRILLQIYAAPDQVAHGGFRRLRAVARRVVAQLRPGSARESTPWGHIQSFSHTAPFIDECVAASGLVMRERHHLTTYRGSSVEVLELQHA